jgi:hypothetical protein
MTAEERELTRRWVQTWKDNAEPLAEIRAWEIYTLTPEKALAAAEDLTGIPQAWRRDPNGSGLVEQQRIFARAHRP